MNNTVEASITGNRINPYPNPLAYQQCYQMHATDSVVFKYVIVNNKPEVLNQSAVKLRTSKLLPPSFADRNQYANKVAVCMYFRFSALNKPNLKPVMAI